VDVETYDPDSESVVLNYVWMGSDQVLDSGVVDVLYRSKWSYPENVNITVRVIPYDTESLEGTPLVIKFRYVPTDTDGDGLYDDANGNGTNDPGDDEDDDDDGSKDAWELILMKDPQDPLSYPQDWDGDGAPDGDPRNTEDWMDTDDDEDGIPDTRDNYPLNPSLPGDMDDDGVGDDADPDIDGDGVTNDEDQDPRNPKIGRAPSGLQLSGLEIALLIILFLIVAAVAGTGYAVYNGKLNLPTNAPPEVAMEKGKPQRPYPLRSKREIALEALEDVDLSDMFVCSECGEVVKKDDDSCPNCGSVFSDDPGDFNVPEDEEEFEAEEE
jgi:hypothetical protein